MKKVHKCSVTQLHHICVLAILPATVTTADAVTDHDVVEGEGTVTKITSPELAKSPTTDSVLEGTRMTSVNLVIYYV